MNLTYGSVCSGVEAASVAWEPLGFRAVWFAEVDRFAGEVLAHHWPDVPNLGDMTTIAARVESSEIGAPDILVGGTPCQAFSVAGLRGGIADDRGALTLSFVELHHAIRKRAPSSIALWENVPGVLSMRDNAFGHLLGGLVGTCDPIELGSGHRWPSSGVVRGPLGGAAWRVLDAQHFGVPQRRRRVFVVACDSAERAAEILFESTSGGGYSSESGQARGETTPPSPGSAGEANQLYGGGAMNESTASNTLTTVQRLDWFTESFVLTPAGGQIANRASRKWPARYVAPLDTGFGKRHGAENQHIDGGASWWVPEGGRVRRLTPIEFERLQGFPDDHTAILSDTQRYKCMGNSMAVPVMRWIGERIAMVRAEAKK